MKPNKEDKKVLLASGVALLLPLLIIVKSKQHEMALKAVAGRYQRKEPKNNFYPDRVYTYDLKPDGTFLLRTDVNEPLRPAMRNNPQALSRMFGQEGLDYLINLDGTISTLERGTFSVGGDEVELKEPEPFDRPPNRWLLEPVATYRVSDKGLTLIRFKINRWDAYTKSTYAKTEDVAPDKQKLDTRIR